MALGKNTRAIGNIGEDLAVKYLEENGYKILERNFQTNFGEIDIIAQIGEIVAIVEVKSISLFQEYMPSWKVNAQKQNHIRKSAVVFSKYYGDDYFYRYDVIEIIAGEINHIEGAFI